MVTRRRFAQGILGTVVTAGLAPAARAQNSTPVAYGATPVADGRLVVHPRGETLVPLEPKTVIALGDEWLLADLLDFEAQVVASSAAYGDSFLGLDPALTEGIEPFFLFSADIETLLLMQPDLIIVGDYVFDYVDGLYETLSAMVPVVSVPDLENWHDDYLFIASVFGAEDRATELIAAYEAEATRVATELTLSGTTVTLATVYPGEPEVAAWLTRNLAEVDVIAQLGATIVPSADDYEVDQAGRIRLALENVAALEGEWMIMLQTSSAPDEQETLAEVLESPLFQTLPSVQAGQVRTIERAGQPGNIYGRMKLLGIYSEIFGA